MHSLKVTLLAVAASLVSAQLDLSQIPTCALEPALSALGATGCAETDFKCICSSETFLTSLEPAVEAACSASDLQKAEAFAVQLCASVGINLSLPGTPSSMSASPATTPPAYPSTSAPASTAAPPMTSAAAGPSTVYVTVPCSTSHAVVSSTKHANVTVTKSATPSVFTGAAAYHTYGSVTLLGGMVAVLGALFM